MAVKTPTEEKTEPFIKTAPAAATTETNAPVSAEASATTAPEAVAAKEAAASAAAPIPQVIEPIPAPIDEPTPAQIEGAGTSVKPVEAAEAAPTEETAAAAEEKKGDEIKFDEAVRLPALPYLPARELTGATCGQTRTEDKAAPKRDLGKLSRRLSGALHGLPHRLCEHTD